jgi:hypothetical protein
LSKEHIIFYDKNITPEGYNVNNKIHLKWKNFPYIIDKIISKEYIGKGRETVASSFR